VQGEEAYAFPEVGTTKQEVKFCRSLKSIPQIIITILTRKNSSLSITTSVYTRSQRQSV